MAPQSSKATQRLASGPHRRFVTSTLHDVLLSASALPVDRRAAFLEKQHAFWSREYGRLHNNSADDRDAYQIMLGVWDMLEELTR